MSNTDYTQPGFPGGPMGGAPQVLTPKGRGRKQRRDRGPRRSAATFRWLFLFFAAAAGLLVMFVANPPNEKTLVVVTRSQIAPLTGVDSDVDAGTMFAIVEVPSESVEPGTFSGVDRAAIRTEFLKALDGHWFLYPVPEKQQVRKNYLVPSGQLETPLAPDERLISISARAADAVAGRIRPGSVVDVYVSSADGLTGVLGQEIEIVSVSLTPEQFDSVAQQQFQDPEKSLSDFVANQPVGGTYVIRVKADKVASYIAADTAGKITLSLRGDEARVFSPAPVDIYATICGENSVEPACSRGGQ